MFCDTEADSFNIDVSGIESKITPKTRGIITVHLCGQPADLAEVQDIARKHNLWLIEDCGRRISQSTTGKRLVALETRRLFHSIREKTWARWVTLVAS